MTSACAHRSAEKTRGEIVSRPGVLRRSRGARPRGQSGAPVAGRGEGPNAFVHIHAEIVRGRVMKLHIMCERDVGLFSLVQQVIANIYWAISESRMPVVYFQSKTCYWTPDGYCGKDTVWEYYFEPVVKDYPASRIPEYVREIIRERPPSPFEVGYFADDQAFVSSHFGDHPALAGKSLFIPYLRDDPDHWLRQTANELINRFVRPRQYVYEKEVGSSGTTCKGITTLGSTCGGQTLLRRKRSACTVTAH